MDKTAIMRFIEAINNQKLEVIIEMMAEDFRFIDTYGDIENKKQMEVGWKGYFEWFPDYYIDINEYVDNDNFAVILGKASASYLGNKEKYWEFPAAWKVITKNKRIVLWQVFCDSKKQLDSMK